jgi:hypothetical protein
MNFRRSLTVLLVSILLTSGYSFAQKLKTPAIKLGGRYVLATATNPEVVGRMVITDWSKSTFIVRGEGDPWVGFGSINGNTGYYDWKFDDGRKGRTTIIINKDKTFTGHVLGSGLNWKYTATIIR